MSQASIKAIEPGDAVRINAQLSEKARRLLAAHDKEVKRSKAAHASEISTYVVPLSGHVQIRE